jgi:hypothetical protein
MPRRMMSGLFVGAVATMLVTPAAAQPRYKFTRIADSTLFGELREPVALNDKGQVSFVATLPNGVTGVFVGSGGAVATVADNTRDFSTFGFPGINGRGQVTFYGNQLARSGFYAGTAADGPTPLIENHGAVQAFVGDIYSSPSGSFSAGHGILRLPGFQQEIFVSDGGRPARVADTSGLFALLDLDPRVNAFGKVVFHGTRRDGSDGIFVGRGGALTTIADSSAVFAFFSDSPAINDRGQVLFQAILNDGTNGLFLSSHGVISTVLDSTGSFFDFGRAPAINDRGQIAFEGSTADLVGIFTGGDSVADRVIAVDDPLDGSTVDSFFPLAFDSALNNRGQLAFIVTLADGRTGIYRADPIRGDGDDTDGRHGDDSESREGAEERTR